MAKPPVEPVEIELIVWHDAVAACGWLDQGAEAPTDIVTTVGYILKETPKYLVIASTWGNNDDTIQSNARMTIPKGMLIRRQTYILD